ncbi:unnamed protein product [Phytophthora fragariaefolia]|uniref:Unnamed protein product n=1 Tax=Phytophthora fragariaefolia TaxID=1490495 RepID=A0A9W6Y8C2_9STRA|nr:unnamed protein product [Phytophthora fragariaefolia]
MREGVAKPSTKASGAASFSAATMDRSPAVVDAARVGRPSRRGWETTGDENTPPGATEASDAAPYAPRPPSSSISTGTEASIKKVTNAAGIADADAGLAPPETELCRSLCSSLEALVKLVVGAEGWPTVQVDHQADQSQEVALSRLLHLPDRAIGSGGDDVLYGLPSDRGKARCPKGSGQGLGRMSSRTSTIAKAPELETEPWGWESAKSAPRAASVASAAERGAAPSTGLKASTGRAKDGSELAPLASPVDAVVGGLGAETLVTPAGGGRNGESPPALMEVVGGAMTETEVSGEAAGGEVSTPRARRARA